MYNAGPVRIGPGTLRQYSGHPPPDLNPARADSFLSSPLLEAQALGCERDGRPLFENLSFALGAGEMLQIAGPNGSGKTSLLRLLSGLMQPSDGQVLLDGQPLARARATQAGASLLWIGHAAGIKGLLTAEENLAWLCALQAPASAEQIREALARVGLRGFEDVPCHTLSAGQQRRVGLARLHLPAPKLWLLDEPFTALDRQAVADLEEHLVRHCEAGGAAVLTTHHALARKPATFRELDLGQHRP